VIIADLGADMNVFENLGRRNPAWGFFRATTRLAGQEQPHLGTQLLEGGYGGGERMDIRVNLRNAPQEIRGECPSNSE
jgi:hypothetical protein